MRVLENRRAVIEWAGRNRAFPVLRSGAPDLQQPGSAEPSADRVGWKGFFAALGHSVVAVEGEDSFEHRILTRAQAHAELPKGAFGPPWYRKVWHEVNLVGTAP